MAEAALAERAGKVRVAELAREWAAPGIQALYSPAPVEVLSVVASISETVVGFPVPQVVVLSDARENRQSLNH